MPRSRKLVPIELVMEGRRFKFTVYERGYSDVTYDVAAVAVSRALTPQHVGLGQVRTRTISTDGTVGGSGGRLRRPGKGRRVYDPLVSATEAHELGYKGERAIIAGAYHVGGMGRRDLWLTSSYRGEGCETRREAAELLAAWHDHPDWRLTREQRDGD